MIRNPFPSRLRKAVANPATAFLLRAAAWFVGLLGFLRLPWVQANLLLPYTQLQAGLAERLLGEELRVFVAASCSGSDAMAVCLGAILAFPTAWRRRLAAAGGGLAVITAVNTLRIAHLSRIAADRELLELFHRRIWPAVIILVAAGYAFAWMSAVTAPGRGSSGTEERGAALRPSFNWPVAALAAVFVAAYYALYDRLLAAPFLAAAADRTAWLAGGLMGYCGVPAEVSGGLLRTGTSTWMVTPECVTTPLIPIALAAALLAPMSWRLRLTALVALPLAFQVLAVARLMVLALPRVLVGSPTVAVHAFYQLLLAVGLVAWLATRRGEGGGRRAATALGAGALAGLVVGTLDLRLLRPAIEPFFDSFHLGHAWVDPQGVLLLLPAFEAGLLTALWATARPRQGMRKLWPPVLVAAVAGAATLVVLGELAAHAALELPVVLLRLWSLALPALVAAGAGWLRPPPRLRLPEPARRAPSPTS